MGMPVQRPAQGPDKSNLVRFADQSKIHFPSRTVLQGWKEIASELDRGVRTVQRWERTLGLPVHRLGKGSTCPVFAFKDELHRWLHNKANDDDVSNGNVTTPLPAAARETPALDKRKTPQSAVLARELPTAKRPTLKSESEIIKSLNAFFALDNPRHRSGTCGHCLSPAQFLVGHFWLYGTDKTWQVSVPFCPNCDSDVHALLPSPSGPQSIS